VSRRVGLVEACDSPQLFGVALWPLQREILAAIEAGTRRLFVLALGRRSGKTLMCALVLLWYCLLRDDLAQFMRPGERRYAVAVATNLRQARLLVAAARSIVERSPLLASLIESATEDELRFTNGTALVSFPCSSRGGRGWPIVALAMDEAAFFLTETEGPQVAQRVFAALAPSTAQFGDEARIMVASTPFGADGFFAETWHRADSGELEDATAFRYPTVAVNPTIGASFLERERARDAVSFASEYEAAFVGSGLAYLDPERIADAVADRPELPPGALADPVAGLDPSFSSDPAGLAIVGRDRGEPDRLRLMKACAWLPRRSQSFEERRLIEDETLAEMIAELKRYRVEHVYTDQFAAAAVLDKLRRAGIPATSIAMSATSKTAAYSELRAKLYAHELELYDNDDLLAELRRLRSRFSAGSASVVNPRVGGSHGDQAQALAMAVYGLADDGYAHGDGGAFVIPGTIANRYAGGGMFG
jgi:phage terminase large subunit-like protein